jgi:hypothetical protein
MPSTPDARLLELEGIPVLVLKPNGFDLDLTRIAALVESWLAEKDAEIVSLRVTCRQTQGERP